MATDSSPETTPDAQAASPTDRSWYDRDVLREQLTILRRESAAREQAEKEIAAAFAAGTTKLSAKAAEATKTIQQQCDQQTAELQAGFAKDSARLEGQTEAEQQALDDKRAKLKAKIINEWKAGEQERSEDLEYEEISLNEHHQQKLEDAKKAAKRASASLDQKLEKAEESVEKSRNVLAQWGVEAAVIEGSRFPELPSASAAESPVDPALDVDEGDTTAAATDAVAAQNAEPLPTGKELFTFFEELADTVTKDARRIRRLPSGRWAFGDGVLVAIFAVPLVLAIVLAAIAWFVLPAELFGMPKALSTVVAAFTPLVLGVAGGLTWRRQKAGQARKEAATLIGELTAKRAQLVRCFVACQQAMTKKLDRQLTKLEEEFSAGGRKREEASSSAGGKAEKIRDKALADLESQYQTKLAALQTKKERGRQALEETYPAQITAAEHQRDEKIAAIEARQQEQQAEIERKRDERWTALTATWRSTREETGRIFKAVEAIDTNAFQSWESLADGSAALPTISPPGLRFGKLTISMAGIAGGVSSHEELNNFGPASWQQPAFSDFPDEAGLVIRMNPAEKETASGLLQALMLRIAAGLPPGQSRFTIIDPLGLGKQFAGFMHLADHDELLVTSRIWTEPPLIEQRLADITEQMELVIQKYLRNEYRSIGDYNAEAEVPEPYRFVVVANFPANFTETAARRLASIATSGARCGVYPIVSLDTTAQLPSNFTLADLEAHTTSVSLKDGQFTWVDPEFSKWPLTAEQSPDDQIFTQIVQRVGKAAVAAKRVEVPFDRVAPPEDKWWTGDTAKGIDVPLGPAGAKKTLSMKLGKGTSQHVLIAGKTGSGKSTMMHALITNLALIYSPNEIQFYLIDFKKGVEFKLYDHYRLPHARVIAIESEREFGLSVLQQLDRELKRRGDLFRELSVQDLAGYRASGHPEPMPRIMLIIDEFQELFVEDDKLAQDCSLVLDRLVRQGRAFGMHVLLGSQTLGGSYSLPRATMGQMAVRVALQCNEADSSLILSEDNTAARLLTRPGEAIYNDANGMVEGNNPFQVVWLGEERRERFLGKLRDLADSRPDIPALPRLVFDGNEAANPAANRLLTELLDSGTLGGSPPVIPQAWLGDAIAIKDPTVATFRRQGGTNLLIVGQREDLAARILSMAMVSLAAGCDPHPGGGLGRAGRFVLFEPAIAEEHPETMLSRLAEFLPHEIEVAGRLAVAEALGDIAGEVQRRLDGQILDAESVFVVIRDLGRFRDMRRNENDFGFSMSGEQAATPAQNLVTILKDGPTVGIHAIIWCDSLTNLQRTFERGTLKEFELRVLFQMSGTDSSQLVESPIAGRLGEQRALYVQEETGTLEKFRPYQFPDDAWLAEVSTKLRARPQGTPIERPKVAPKPAAPPADDDGGFSLKHGFGADEFNFAKMLDDPPTDSKSDDTADPDAN